MKKLMILILVGIILTSCSDGQRKPDLNNESPSTNTIKLIEQSEFINYVGRIMVVEIQEHYYIILNGSDRGHPIHAESCPKTH